VILLGSLCIVLSLTSPGAASTKGTRPTAPRQVRVVAGNASATVTFLPPTSNGGYKVSDYRVDTHPSNQIHKCTSTTCRISGLTNGTTYFFRVDAVNKIGAGPYSNPSNKVTPRASPVTVTFNANGCSGAMPNETENYNVVAALTTNAFTCTGYTFTGWNTAANVSGTSYANGATYAFTISVNLYAQWTINTYTVTFNANGCSGAMPNETESYNVVVALTNNAFTCTGYTFGGWNTAPNGSGTSYANGATYAFTTSVNLYAQWTINTYTVTFNANGGSGTMTNETENYNVATDLSANTFTRTGYTFDGWNTAVSGGGTSFTNGATYSFAASVTLYAQWIIASPTIPAENQSTNWAGYVVPSSSALITDAQGDWIVPTLNCTDTPNGQSSIWVGIGGEQWATGGSSGSLLQTGTNDICVNGVQQDSAWWEVVPATPNYEQGFTNFPVSPGDVMQAAVFHEISGAWATRLTDVNTGLSAYMVTGASWGVGLTSATTYTPQGSAALINYAGAYTAEWIVEAPTNSTTLGLYPIASFDPVTFTNLRASFTSWTLDQSETWAIVQNGVTLATPTATFADGFTVSYTGP
jgi:uncharacterized repeat protein (TIGR02543 family)